MNFFISIVTCLFLCTSCFTFNISTTGASIPIEAQTVSVQYFQNQANYVEAGLAQQFTDNLTDYIQGNSRLIPVSSNGDIDFEGVITGFGTQPVSIVAGDQASQNRFTITVRIKFTCVVDPQLDFESSFSRYEDYDSRQDFETVKIKLTENIMALLLEDIYNRAFVNW